jgi:hypothetical protein
MIIIWILLIRSVRLAFFPLTALSCCAPRRQKSFLSVFPPKLKHRNVFNPDLRSKRT